jgi:hypothetical protein
MLQTVFTSKKLFSIFSRDGINFKLKAHLLNCHDLQVVDTITPNKMGALAPE